VSLRDIDVTHIITRHMLPIPVLKGYYYDETTKRYYAIKNGHINEQPKPAVIVEPISQMKKKPRNQVFDERWLLERNLAKINNMVELPSPRGISSLRISRDGELAGLTEGSNLWLSSVQSWTEWNRSFTLPMRNSSNLVVDFEAASWGVLDWNPLGEMILYAGGREEDGMIRLFDNAGEVLTSKKLNFLPLCVAWQPDKSGALIIGESHKKGVVINAEMGVVRESPRLSSEVLSCTFLDSNATALGLRNGSVMLWDTRQNGKSASIGLHESLGAPVTKLVRSTHREGLVFVHAPKGLEGSSSLLWDLKFPKSPLASFNLMNNFRSPSPQVTGSGAGNGDLVFGVDIRSNKCTVFELETARMVTEVPLSFPTVITSFVIHNLDSQFEIIGSGRSGIFRFNAVEKDMA
jgi:WD40 repeat protein